MVEAALKRGLKRKITTAQELQKVLWLCSLCMVLQDWDTAVPSGNLMET